MAAMTSGDPVPAVEPDSDTVGPLVTIVTPSLNQGRFIRDTIESVQAQDYPRIEHLIQDGGSKDETIDVLRHYDGCVDWVSAPDRSQSEAITKGFRRGHGQILTWLNSDDLLLPGAVSAAVRAFEEDLDLGLVYGDGYVTDVDAVGRRLLELPEPNLWDLVHLNCYIFQPSCFFRSQAFWAVGGLDEGLRWVMDWDLFVRITMRYPTAHVATPWAVQRVYDGCLTMSGGLPRYRELASVVRRHSGQRYPPACALYLSETIVTGVTQRLRASSLPSAKLEAVVTAAGQRVASATQNRTRQLHGDGWVRPRSELWLVRRGGDALEVSGEVPASSGRPEMRLRVDVEGHGVADVMVPPGPFRLLCALPEAITDQAIVAGQPRRPVRVRFEADHSFRPRRENGRHDGRLVSWRLTRLRWVDTRDVELPRPVGWYEDGWAGPRVHASLHPAGVALEIRGELQGDYEPLRGQQLTIRSATREIARVRLATGPFAVRVEPCGTGPLIALELAADQWFVPSDEGINGDGRRLSYRLSELVWVA